MNERIKELAEQAKFSARDLHIQNDNFQKFAELIVRESIVDFYTRYLDTTSNEHITVQVERYVKEHFGRHPRKGEGMKVKVRFYCDVPSHGVRVSGQYPWILSATTSPPSSSPEGWARVAFDVNMPEDLVLPPHDVLLHAATDAARSKE